MMWIHRIEYDYGTTAQSAGVVVAVFFISAAVGNLCGGWVTRRFSDAVTSFRLWAVTGLLAGLTSLSAWFFMDAIPLPAAWMGACWLSAPTSFLLGMGFPLLGHVATQGTESLTPQAGAIYTADLVGATSAIAICGLWLPVQFYYSATVVVACALLMGGAVVAGCLSGVWKERWKVDSVQKTTSREGTPTQRHESVLSPVLVVILSGFLSLSFEMVAIDWIRHLSGFSILAYLTVLLVFTGGLAAGAALATGLRRRGKSAFRLLTWALMGSSFLILAGTASVQGLIQSGNDGVVLPGILIFPCVLISGMIFPLAWDLVPAGQGHGWALGRLTLWNKLAAGAGALSTVFLWVPWFGIQSTAFLIALGYAGLGVFMLGKQVQGLAKGMLLPGSLCLVSIIGFLSPWHPVRIDEGSERLDIDYGSYGSVAVVQSPRPSRHIVVDNRYTLNGTSESLVSQRNQSWIPLALTEKQNPRMLILGMGSGISAAAALDFPLARVEAVELVPEVVDAGRRWFNEWNAPLFEDSRATIHVQDARYFLSEASPGETWDTIVCDLFLPLRPGARAFYTQSFFDDVRDHLTEQGVFVLWIPVYQWRSDLMQSLLQTFRDTFPESILIRGNMDPFQPILGLVASPGKTWNSPLFKGAIPPHVQREEDLFFKTAVNSNLIYVASMERLTLGGEVRRIEDDSLWFTYEAAGIGAGEHLRGTRLLHWVTDTFGTDRDQSPLSRAARAANHLYAAIIQSMPMPNRDQAERDVRALRHQLTADRLYPEGEW